MKAIHAHAHLNTKTKTPQEMAEDFIKADVKGILMGNWLLIREQGLHGA